MKTITKEIIFFIIILILLIYPNIKIQTKQPEIKVYQININISNNYTTNINENMLNINIPAGQSISTQTKITNNEEKTISINSQLQGQIKTQNWVSINENSFSLKLNEEKNIQINIHPPINAQGNLSGELIITTI